MSEIIQAHTRAEVIAGATSGVCEVWDLQSNIKFRLRTGPPVGYDHSDWMPETEADCALLRQAGGRSWEARPAVITYPNGFKTAISYHTFNHSIRLFAAAYGFGIVPEVTRATERVNGAWVPGHHCCVHFADSWRLRADDNFTRNMKAAVERAAVLANAMGEEQYPTMPLLYVGSSGEYVKEAQRLINEKGYTPALSVDGGFGALTKAGVEWVQKQYGIEVSGMVTIGTWRLLRAEESYPTVEEEKMSGTGNNPSAWAADATRWAIERNIFVGDGDGNYDWQGNITREQVAQVLYNMFEAPRKGDMEQ